MKIFAIGSTVGVAGVNLEDEFSVARKARVVSVRIYGKGSDHVEYNVAFWAGGERVCVALDAFEVYALDDPDEPDPSESSDVEFVKSEEPDAC